MDQFGEQSAFFGRKLSARTISIAKSSLLAQLPEVFYGKSSAKSSTKSLKILFGNFSWPAAFPGHSQVGRDGDKRRANAERAYMRGALWLTGQQLLFFLNLSIKL